MDGSDVGGPVSERGRAAPAVVGDVAGAQRLLRHGGERQRGERRRQQRGALSPLRDVVLGEGERRGARQPPRTQHPQAHRHEWQRENWQRNLQGKNCSQNLLG